jgi:hypothetical protein
MRSSATRACCSITMKFVLYNGYFRKFTYAFLTLKFLNTGRFSE